MTDANGSNPLEGPPPSMDSAGSPPPPKKPRKPSARRKVKEEANRTQRQSDSDPADFRPGNSKEIAGRLASQIAQRPVTWFVPDLVPNEVLTLVIGPPDAGKSTFGAWLCSKAKRPAILPGCEESAEIALVPRLAHNGVKMDRCLLLDTRTWTMPSNRQLLTDTLARHGADFLWIDPIDTYVTECSENEGPGVRAALEAFSKVASELHIPVVAARHPGKDPRNLCPGSRQWRAVPRMILEITVDRGPPMRRFIGPFRDPFGTGIKPREVHLVGFDRQPKVFKLGDQAKAADVEFAGESDVIERSMIDSAEQLLKALLANGEQEGSIVYKHAESERLKDRTVRKAAKRLGVQMRREGSGLEHKVYWSLVDSGTPAHRDRHTPPRTKNGPSEGVSIPECRSAGVPESGPSGGSENGTASPEFSSSPRPDNPGNGSAVV